MARRRALLLVLSCLLAGCYRTRMAEPERLDSGSGRAGGTAHDGGQLDAAPRDPAPDAEIRSGPPGMGVLIGQVVNARDLGGMPLADGATVAFGTLFRGPPLANLSKQGCLDFSRLGIRTVVDLRIPSERASTREAPCVEESVNLVFAPLPVPYSVSPQDYIADLNATESVAEAFRALGDASAYPIYFHCTWGRDRTGVLAAVILLALGAAPDDIMQEYLISRQTVGAYPNSLEAVLREIDRRGGVEAYLESAGVSSDALATLRERAVMR